MKIKRFSILLLLITISTLTLIISLRNASAQDYVKWSLPEGAKMRIGKGGIDDLQFSPDGTRLAVAGAIGIWIYDVHMGKELDLFTGHTSPVRSVCFSPDGMTLASGSWDKTIRLWDVATGKHLNTLTGHTDRVASVCFSAGWYDACEWEFGRNYTTMGCYHRETLEYTHWSYEPCW